MRKENKSMIAFLKRHRIPARVKYIWDGSLRGTWRLYNPDITWYGNKELQEKLTSLGFKDFDGKELNDFSGNGGVFSVFVKGNDTFVNF